MQDPTRVLIISDTQTVRADLRTRLGLLDAVAVVGEAAGPADLPEPDPCPDLLLVDLDRPGPRAAGEDDRWLTGLRRRWPAAALFILSAADPRGLPPGADAWFVKGAGTDRMFTRIRNFQTELERKTIMNTTSELQAPTLEQARPAAAAHSQAASRLGYIDVLRMVLIILVIMVHAAVTYGSLGDWTYEDPIQDESAAVSLSFFVIACQAFFMGLYFFFAGYFTPRSYDRKGPAGFWKDRLLRLGLPMLAYTLVLSKIPNYINDVANEGVRMSFGKYFVRYFWVVVDEGPTWFLFALLIFSAGYTLWRLATRSASLGGRLSRVPAPGVGALLLAALVMGGFSFAIAQVWPYGEMTDILSVFSFQLQFFPTYIILFAAGALAYRSGWLPQLPGRTLRLWAPLSAALLVALPVFFFLGGATEGMLDSFMGGLDWRCALLSLWLGLACIAFSLTLTLWLRDRAHPSPRLAALAGANNFAVYLIHPLVLVPITYGLSFLLIPSLVKFAVASLTTVAACYALAIVLRHLPGLKQIL